MTNSRQESASPLEDLALFVDKKLVVLGGYGSSNNQWRSMWDAFKQYGDGKSAWR